MKLSVVYPSHKYNTWALFPTFVPISLFINFKFQLLHIYVGLCYKHVHSKYKQLKS